MKSAKSAKISAVRQNKYTRPPKILNHDWKTIEWRIFMIFMKLVIYFIFKNIFLLLFVSMVTI